MQSDILKMRIVVFVFIVTLILSCNNKSDLKNEITIKLNSIDSKTKHPRVNLFDTIVVRKEGIGYLMKTFHKVGEYITDSSGSVKIKIDCTENYQIRLYGLNVIGSNEFTKKLLKDGQEVNIEVFSIENR